MSTETAFFQIVHRLEKSLIYKDIALGTFLDIDNTSLLATVEAAK
jgi:hypothetical protein